MSSQWVLEDWCQVVPKKYENPLLDIIGRSDNPSLRPLYLQGKRAGVCWVTTWAATVSVKTLISMVINFNLKSVKRGHEHESLPCWMALIVNMRLIMTACYRIAASCVCLLKVRVARPLWPCGPQPDAVSPLGPLSLLSFWAQKADLFPTFFFSHWE